VHGGQQGRRVGARVQQLVLVGNEHKLALLAVGQLSIGILSPCGVELGAALSR
jgi:hypothetical protein